MKLSQISPLWKFLAGLVVYALVIWGITLFDDYRVSVFGFFTLCFITFAMALWLMVSNKRFVAVLLAAGLTIESADAQPAGAPAQKDAVGAIIAGAAILIVGGVIIWGLHKICKKMPKPPKPGQHPPCTNEPPQDAFIGQFQTNVAASLVMPDYNGLSEYNDWDTAVIKFQTCTNGQDWNDEYTITNWVNNSQWVSIMYSNSLPLKTNWGSVYWTNDAIVSDFSAVMPTREQAPLKLWREVQIQ